MRRGEPRCGSSQPAQVGLHLIPGDIVARFAHGFIECCDVVQFLRRGYQPSELFGIHEDHLGVAAFLDDDRLAVSALDHLGEPSTGFGDANGHEPIVHLDR